MFQIIIDAHIPENQNRRKEELADFLEEQVKQFYFEREEILVKKDDVTAWWKLERID